MKTILAFGDSNTHGTMPMANARDRRRFARDIRWPNVMARALGDGFEIICEGQPGRSTVHDDPIEGGHKAGVRTLLPILESHRPIDLVIVMLGTNDLKARFSLTAQDVALGVERLVQIMIQSDCGPGGSAPMVLVVSPPPIVSVGPFKTMYEGGAEKSLNLAAELRAMSEVCGVSFWDAAEVAEVDAIEGIHLTEMGHRQLGDALAARVLEID